MVERCYNCNMFDCIVIGGGPAGMAASVYFARQKLRFALFTGKIGGQAVWSSDVENYLGLHQITGVKLVELFREHLDDYRDVMEMHEGEKIQRIEKTSGGFSVHTDKGAYPTKTVLIATGARHRHLNVPGEKELMNKGVSYCAPCDAPLFADKVVYVIGGGNSAMDASLFLSLYAKEIHMLSLNEELVGDEVLKRKCLRDPKITYHPSAKTIEFQGEPMLQSIVYEDANGKHVAPTDGVLIEIGVMPQAEFVDFVKKDARGQIEVDLHNRTNVEGIWAAGDVTTVMYKQISVAVGEGSKASLDIIHYLQGLPS